MNTLDFNAIKSEYNLNNDQMRAFKILLNNDMVFLTGQAGTGKSYLLKSYIDFIKKMGGDVMVTAPTGVAALLLHGSTLHRTFQIPIPIKKAKHSKEEIRNKMNGRLGSILSCADILIIDEISMCRIDIFEYVMSIIQTFNEENPKNIIRVILCGDFLQLPPVLAQWEKTAFQELRGSLDIFPFQSKKWEELDIKTVELKTIVRQDSHSEFAHNLNKARIGDASCINYFNNLVHNNIYGKAIKLSGTNKSVNIINERENSKIHGISKIYIADVIGEVKDSEKPTLEKLELKPGSRVMSVINDTKSVGSLRYSNGSLGTVVKMEKDNAIIKFDSFPELVSIEPYTWDIIKYDVSKIHHEDGRIEKRIIEKKIGSFTQLPLKLAFAVTIHKSQGQTYDKVEISPFAWDYGQLYVALSRCKSADSLSLSYPISSKYLMANSDVVEFLSKVNTSLDYGNELTDSAVKMLDRISNKKNNLQLSIDFEQDYDNKNESSQEEDNSNKGFFERWLHNRNYSNSTEFLKKCLNKNYSSKRNNIDYNNTEYIKSLKNEANKTKNFANSDVGMLLSQKEELEQALKDIEAQIDSAEKNEE